MMDKNSRAEEYRKQSDRYLLEGEALLNEGNLQQASEKFWGATASMVKAIGEKNGWEHNGHAALYKIIDRLARGKNLPEIRKEFGIAGHLHTNFYENWLDKEGVSRLKERVEKLLKKLREIYGD